MKLKIDFVTNSSSAAFMLMVKIDGYMPLWDIPNLVKYFKNLEYKVKDLKKYPYYSDVANRHELIFRINPYGDGEDTDPKYILNTEKVYMYEGNEEDQPEKERNRISIVGTNPNYHNQDSLDTTRDVAAIIVQNLIHGCNFKEAANPLDFQFSVRIEPTDFRGDGWNGDPSGPYQQIPQAIKAETKFGTMFINEHNLLQFKLYDLNGKLVVKGPPGI